MLNYMIFNIFWNLKIFFKISIKYQWLWFFSSKFLNYLVKSKQTLRIPVKIDDFDDFKKCEISRQNAWITW